MTISSHTNSWNNVDCTVEAIWGNLLEPKAMLCVYLNGVIMKSLEVFKKRVDEALRAMV